MRFEHVGYHDYEGVVLELGERERLRHNLGQNDVMFLRNHGVLAVGRSIAEAFNNTYRIERACKPNCLLQHAVLRWSCRLQAWSQKQTICISPVHDALMGCLNGLPCEDLPIASIHLIKPSS